MADEQTVVDQTATLAAPVTVPLPAPDLSGAAPPVEPPSRRDVIAKAFNTPPETTRGRHAQFQPRQEQGKFAPGPPQIPPPERPAMPKSLKKELEVHWNTAPVELAAAIHQRELDYEKGVQPLKAKAQQADELLAEFQPYEMLLRAEGATPKQAIGSLLQTAALLRTGTPAQKAYAVAQMIQQFQIPVQNIQQLLAGQAPASENPQYQQLSQRLQTFEQNLSAREQREREQAETRAMAAIQTFAASPDHAHFEAVQDEILDILQSAKFQQEHGVKSDAEKLQIAYDRAVRLNDAVYQQVLAEQQAKGKQKTQIQTAKAAAVQIKGAPAPSPAGAIDPKDRRAVIVDAMRRAST